MAFVFPTPTRIISQLKAAFSRFPATVLSTLISMVLILFLIEVDGPEFTYFEETIKIVFVLSLGIFMFTALRLLGEKNPLCIVGIVALVGYYFVLPPMKDPSSMVFFRHFYLILMFFIMIWWAPFWKHTPDNGTFWEWNQQIVFGFLTSIVFTIILFAGLSGALYALDALFSLDVSGIRYPQLLVIIIGLFGVNYFLSQIPQNVQNLHIHTYTKVENIFTKYILTPMTLGYFLILYAYTFKILFTQSWPKGILAWIIIAFSAVAITTYLFWTPLWREKAKNYKRFFALALWLQTILLGVAIWMRVDAYGWTESRYMVAILGLWLFGVSLYFLLFKGAKYKWIFMALSAVIMISQVGPFSSYAIGEKSQQHRLKKMLAQAQPLTLKTPLKTRFEISDSITYLSQRYGLESLEGIMPDIVAKFNKEHLHDDLYVRYSFPDFATKELGFNYVDKWQMMEQKNGTTRPMGFYRPQNFAQNIAGYDWMCEVMYNGFEHNKHVPKAFKGNLLPEINTWFLLDDKSLIIQEDNVTIATIPLEAFYAKVLADETLQNMGYREEQIDINWAQKLDLPYEDDKVKVKLLFHEVSGDSNGTFFNIFAKVLYKRK